MEAVRLADIALISERGRWGLELKNTDMIILNYVTYFWPFVEVVCVLGLNRLTNGRSYSSFYQQYKALKLKIPCHILQVSLSILFDSK